MVKIIFLNGPPLVGKDSIGLALGIYCNNNYRCVKVATPLKEATCNLLGISMEYLEKNKEKNVELSDEYLITIRQFLIKLSEEFIKPTLGKDIFGKLLLKNLDSFQLKFYDYYYKSKYARIVITDCGFIEECIPVINKFGSQNCVLVKLYDRDGKCNFDNDSRNYLPENLFKHVIKHTRIEDDIKQTTILLHGKINVELFPKKTK